MRLALFCLFIMSVALISCAKEEQSAQDSFDNYTQKYTRKIIPITNGYWIISSTVEPPASLISSSLNYIDGVGLYLNSSFQSKDNQGTILDAEVSKDDLITVSPTSITRYTPGIDKTILQTAKNNEYFKLIASDSNGKCWILSNEAIFSLEGDIIQLPRDIYCSDFEIDQNNTFWLASTDTIYHIDGNRTYKYDIDQITGQHSNASIYTLRIDKKNVVWINTSEQIYQFKQGVWTNFSTGNYLENDFTTIPFMDMDVLGNIWLAERNYQEFTNLHCYNGSSWTTYKLNPPIETWINDIDSAGPGYIWVATYSGLLKIALSK